ncbi:MAG: hypothetical protein WDN48_02885 [Pseudolabrys sp.]
MIVFAAFMHLLAISMVGRYAEATPDKATLVVVTAACCCRGRCCCRRRWSR